MDILKMEGVECSTKNLVKILSDISLKIKKGECILLMGLSGSGKTTITKLINGIIPHFDENISLKGNVFIEGKLTKNIEQYQISEKVGSIFQNPKSQFFNSDVEGEIAFGLENKGVNPKVIREVLTETIDKLRIDRLRNKDVLYLSSGEKQILAFASIYALNTDIVVLDEPSSNLDKESIDLISKSIETFKNEGKTIIIAEHRLYYLKDMIDRAYYIERGRIKYSFTKKEFISLNKKNEKELEIRTLNRPRLNIKHKNFNEKDDLICREITCKKERGIVFDNIKISTNRGEILGIIGKNGVGKTSLLKALAGLNKNIKGRFYLDGKELNDKQRLERTYLVTQDINSQLFTNKVIEECRLNLKKEKYGFVDEVLDRLGLFEYREAHPMSLSGGQKQRLTIALALLSDKDILGFDEPTSGLDYKNMILVSQIIREFAEFKNKIIIIVSHDYEFLNMVADNVIELI